MPRYRNLGRRERDINHEGLTFDEWALAAGYREYERNPAAWYDPFPTESWRKERRQWADGEDPTEYRNTNRRVSR